MVNNFMKRSQTLTGLVRQRLAHYEQQINFGIRQEVFVDELCKEGYPTSLLYFRKILSQARKRAKEDKKVTNQISNEHNPVIEEKNIIQNNSTSDPLKKSAGFEYSGTTNIDPSDLF
jgi:hypothetical protein